MNSRRSATKVRHRSPSTGCVGSSEAVGAGKVFENLRMDELGDFPYKGIAEPVKVYQVSPYSGLHEYSCCGVRQVIALDLAKRQFPVLRAGKVWPGRAGRLWRAGDWLAGWRRVEVR
jgi:hypothetical protein